MAGQIKYPKLADRAWMEAQYIGGKLTAWEISLLIGCDQGSVTYWLRKHGIPTRDVNTHIKQYWSQSENERLREMWERGDSSPDIALELGRTECSVRGQVRALGLPRRKLRTNVFRQNGMLVKTTPSNVSVLSPRGNNLDSSRLAYLIAEGLVLRARRKAA